MARAATEQPINLRQTSTSPVKDRYLKRELISEMVYAVGADVKCSLRRKWGEDQICVLRL
mgnify:CR=1 FL=1